MTREFGKMLLAGSVVLALAAAPSGFARAAAHEAEVTFQDVLDNPDDVEISIKWAKRQIKENRLEQAAATLERVILIAPNADEVRLLYAVVLYRLGNLVESQAELDILKGRELSAESAKTRDDYLGRIANEVQVWSQDVVVGFGLHYDSNKTFTPTTNRIFLNNVVIGLNDAQESDTGALAFLAYTAHYDPQNEFVDEIYGRVTAVHDNQKEVRDLDLTALSGSFGAKGGYKDARIEGQIGTDVVRFNQDNVVDIYRSSAKVEFPMKAPNYLTPFGDIRLAYENFDSPRDGRDGGRYEIGVGATAILDAKAKVTGRVSLDVKDADDAFEDFIAPEIEFSLVHVLEGGQGVQIDLSYRHESYRKADPGVNAARKRKDNEVEVGLKYVASLERLFRHWEWDVNEDIFKDMNFTAGASLQRNNSNIDNFEFVNMRMETLLTKTFRF